ncbi:MAG: hypothetical protein WED00_13620 [Aquisalimonadaceae bacterium]
MAESKVGGGYSPDHTGNTAKEIDKKNDTVTKAGKKVSESNQQAALERTKFKMAETNTNTIAGDGAKGASNLANIS